MVSPKRRRLADPTICVPFVITCSASSGGSPDVGAARLVRSSLLACNYQRWREARLATLLSRTDTA
jgi:hypothetical protein